MKAICARTPWFTDVKDDECRSQRAKDEERPFASLRMTATCGALYCVAPSGRIL
jgi:hypothetical protein